MDDAYFQALAELPARIRAKSEEIRAANAELEEQVQATIRIMGKLGMTGQRAVPEPPPAAFPPPTQPPASPDAEREAEQRAWLASQKAVRDRLVAAARDDDGARGDA